MKKLLERAIVSSIVKEQKTIGSISNYGILRYASGIFMVRVYWKGQTKKGDKRCITIEMDTEPQSAVLAIEIMEDLMDKARKVGLKEKMRAIGFIDEDEIETGNNEATKQIAQRHKTNAQENMNNALLSSEDKAKELGW